jgi:hypothetical protein
MPRIACKCPFKNQNSLRTVLRTVSRSDETVTFTDTQFTLKGQGYTRNRTPLIYHWESVRPQKMLCAALFTLLNDSAQYLHPSNIRTARI